MKPFNVYFSRLLIIMMAVMISGATCGQTFEAGWPAPNDAVYAVAYDPATSTVFIGGNFTSVGGQSRGHIASYNSLTGTLNAWAPVIDGAVYSLKVVGGTLYVGGDFELINGTTRNNLAAFTIATGALVTTWNPNVDGVVEGMDISGTTLYICGSFYAVQGVPHARIAAVSTSGLGTPTAFNPGYPLDIVRSISVSGSTVYVGGWFTSIGGTSRAYLAALDATTGALLAWNPSAGDRVKSLLVSGSTIYAAGSFYSAGGASRTGIVALDGASGTATSWNAGLNAAGLAIASSGGLVYVGGAFTSAGGQSRNGLAAISASTGLATAWNPGLADGPNTIYVYTIAVGDGKLFVGGEFQTVGGVQHPYFAVWSGFPTVGISEQEPMAVLEVSPNPSTGAVRLTGVDPRAQSISIHDPRGRLVHELDFAGELDLTGLPAGVYCMTALDAQRKPIARSRLVMH